MHQLNELTLIFNKWKLINYCLIQNIIMKTCKIAQLIQI